MSSSVNGRGGSLTMYLKHCDNQHPSCSSTQSILTYLQTGRELLLLLVNDAETEIDLVGLLKARLHAHHLRKRLFGVLERAVAIVQNADTIPELGLLLYVSNHGSPRGDAGYIPLGPAGGRVPAGRQSKPAAGRPS